MASSTGDIRHHRPPADPDPARAAATRAEPAGPAASRAGAGRESLAWLGWFRFAAIVGVILIHVNGLNAGADPGRTTDVGRLAILLDFVSRWSVPAFVMASGAMLLDPARFPGDGPFLRRRAGRLLPALVFWHLVYAAVVTYRRGVFDPAALLHATLTGKLYTALYFFWIVLGLALVSPLLVPWIAQARLRTVGIAGALLALMPAVTMATVPTAPASEAWVRTAFTWWIPYLGYFVLGYAVRRAPLRAAPAVGSALAWAGGMAWVIWQWRQAGPVGTLLERHLPAESYFHPAVAVSACASMYLARALVHPDGPLRPLARGAGARLGRRLGDVTLGVFASHQLVLWMVESAPLIGGGQIASGPGVLLARCVVVTLGAYAFALVASRIPLLNRLV